MIRRRRVPALVVASWLVGAAAGGVLVLPGGSGPGAALLGAVRAQLPAGVAAPTVLSLRASSVQGSWQLAVTLAWREAGRPAGSVVVGAARSPLPAGPAAAALAQGLSLPRVAALLGRLPAVPGGGAALLRVEPGAAAPLLYCWTVRVRAGPSPGRCLSLDGTGRQRAGYPAVLRVEPAAGPFAVSAGG